MFVKSFSAAVIAATGLSCATPAVIDDLQFFANFTEKAGQLADRGNATNGATLAKALANAPAHTSVELPTAFAPLPGYEAQSRSVFFIGSVYNCGKCSQWHIGAGATAWCLTAHGLMVTNHHVFEGAKGDSWAVAGIDGRVHRVLDIVATNADDDLALFLVDGNDLQPLPLGADAPVGSRVSIISHPDRRCFFFSSGEVARYSKAHKRNEPTHATWMSVTADFAKGSSGGPVLNADGAVVGMVSSTQSISYGQPDKQGNPKGPHQMVIRNCVPVAAIRAMTSDRNTAAVSR